MVMNLQDARGGPSTAVDRKRPIRVVLATPLGRGGKGGMDRLADLVIDTLDADPDAGFRVSHLTTKGGISKFRGFFVFAFAVARLFALLVMRRVDVLHLNQAAYGSFYRKWILAKMASVFGVPYVIHIHAGRFAPFWDETRGWTRRTLHQFMRDSAAIIVLGRSYVTLVEKHVPDCAEKVVCLPNATPLRERSERTGAASGDDRCQITFLGLLAPMKGTPQLVDALGQLSSHDGWQATLAGHGDVEETKAHIASLGLSDRIDVPGWLEVPEVDALLARTDIFVLPSFSEGLPMAIIEAFARGVAVIATPVNAVVDVVRHEENGLFIEPGDVAGLRDALARLLDDDALRARLAEAGFRDHRQFYAPEPYIKRLTSVWQSAHKAGV